MPMNLVVAEFVSRRESYPSWRYVCIIVDYGPAVTRIAQRSCFFMSAIRSAASSLTASRMAARICGLVTRHRGAGVRDARAWHGDDLGRRCADLGSEPDCPGRESGACHLALLPLHALSTAARRRPPDRQSAISPPEGGARPPAIDCHCHDHPQRRALAAPTILLDQRMGGDVDAERPRRGHGIRAARLVLQQRDRPLAGADHRSGLLPA